MLISILHAHKENITLNMHATLKIIPNFHTKSIATYQKSAHVT